MLFLAIALVVFVLSAAVVTVGSDLLRRQAGERLVGLKEWQALVGAVLGFMGAAGVLVLSTAFQRDTVEIQSEGRAHAIGFGLALESERMSGWISTGLGISAQINAAPPDANFTKLCTRYIQTLNQILPKKQPLWEGVIDNMVDFGDDNLALFTRFYGTYADVIHDIESPDTTWCESDGKTKINEITSRLQGAMDFYRIIAQRYGTSVVEPLGPLPATPLATDTPPAPTEQPADATPTPPATVVN